MMAEKKLRCPECNSSRMVKAGRIFSGRKKAQRYLCQNCGFHTIYPRGSK